MTEPRGSEELGCVECGFAPGAGHGMACVSRGKASYDRRASMTEPRESSECWCDDKSNEPCDGICRLMRDNERLRDALLVAADDLYKAANQFAGLYQGLLCQYVQEGLIPGRNVEIFEKKAAHARHVAQSGQKERGSDE